MEGFTDDAVTRLADFIGAERRRREGRGPWEKLTDDERLFLRQVDLELARLTIANEMTSEHTEDD
jgi:hypothetical protein